MIKGKIPRDIMDKFIAAVLEKRFCYCPLAFQEFLEKGMSERREKPKCEHCGNTDFYWEVFSPIDTVETAICRTCGKLNWDIKRPCSALVDQW